MKKAKPEPKQISTVFKENLKTKLSEDEMTAYSKDMSEKYIEHGEVESEKKSKNSHFKGKTDVLEAQMAELSRKVSTQHEWRDVECHWAYNFSTNVKVLIRLDTGEVVREETVTDKDRQKLFPIEIQKPVRAKPEEVEKKNANAKNK